MNDDQKRRIISQMIADEEEHAFRESLRGSLDEVTDRTERIAVLKAERDKLTEKEPR